MRHRRHLLSDEDGIKEIWPSFTDVMTTLSLILFVLVLLAFVRNLVTSKRAVAFQHQIALSETKLHELEADLSRTTAQIQASQSALDQSNAIIADNNRELSNLRLRLQGIALLRVDVLNKVKQAIEAELRTVHKEGTDVVRIGDNGNVVINESLVFEFNSFAIKKEGKPLLDTLAKALGNVLSDANVRDNIDAVLVQGHTDERGSASFNRDLSAKRSNAVLNYLFEANKDLEQSYGSYFASSAYSKFRPINPSKTEAAYEQNRRIEISVVLKDANVRQVIDDYMQATPPAPAQPAAR